MSDYPNKPGVKPGSPETAFDAAEEVAEAAASRSLKAMVFVASQRANGATADEVAEAHEWERYSSRPRIAELHARGAIVDIGQRRKGASGRNQVVWVLPEYGPPPPADAQTSFLDAA